MLPVALPDTAQASVFVFFRFLVLSDLVACGACVPSVFVLFSSCCVVVAHARRYSAET